MQQRLRSKIFAKFRTLPHVLIDNVCVCREVSDFLIFAILMKLHVVNDISIINKNESYINKYIWNKKKRCICSS